MLLQSTAHTAVMVADTMKVVIEVMSPEIAQIAIIIGGDAPMVEGKENPILLEETEIWSVMGGMLLRTAAHSIIKIIPGPTEEDIKMIDLLNKMDTEETTGGEEEGKTEPLTSVNCLAYFSKIDFLTLGPEKKYLKATRR